MRNKLGVLIFGVAVIGLTGCSYVPNAVNPVSWYRGLTGASKNDQLGAGDNQQNLDEGSNEPYPNLANVPAAPDTQLSGVDRDKLVDSLIADRRNAQYSADNLRAGEVASTVPPPAPPAAANPKGGGAAPVTASAAAAPAPVSTPTPAPTTTASAPPARPVPPAPTATPNTPTTPPGTAATNTGRRLPPRGSEAPAAESSLQSPSIPNVPQGETPPPALPPPARVAPQVASAAPPAAATRAPVLRPPTQSASAPATGAPSHSAISYRVADVTFAPGSAYLSGALRGTIAEVVKLHNDQGGRIRIVGFGEATGQDAAVAGLTLALDRAQAVAVALTDSGVAAKDINVEAAPVPARGGADAPRAEIYLEQ